ncbi:MAG: VCBS repeat-containing protein [Verrucomicrobiales bacterium]|nr:VCBS repeat-containing protein [Verrucomicrobiales bacterium]
MKTVTVTLIFLIILAAANTLSAADWERHTIDPASGIDHRSGADGIRPADINGDGLIDFVTGWEQGNAIRFCLNPGPEKVKEPWEATTVAKVTSAEDAVFADLDGDGVLDVITATEGKRRTVFVSWAPNEQERITDSTAWKTSAFPETKNKQWWMYTLPLDVDLDGDIDLLLGSKSSGASLTWLENPGHKRARTLTAWETHRLFDVGWIMSLRLLEENGKRNVVFSDRKGLHSGVFLLPLLQEEPWFGKPVCIGAPNEEVMFLDLAYLDDDEKLDVVAAIRPRGIKILYQPDKPLSLWEDTADLDPIPEGKFGEAKAVRVGDLDGDAIPDFAITCEHADGKKRGVLWSNVFSEYFPISNERGVKFDRIELIDLDADGDLDLVTCEEKTGLGVIWFENPLH